LIGGRKQDGQGGKIKKPCGNYQDGFIYVARGIEEKLTDILDRKRRKKEENDVLYSAPQRRLVFRICSLG